MFCRKMGDLGGKSSNFAFFKGCLRDFLNSSLSKRTRPKRKRKVRVSPRLKKKKPVDVKLAYQTYESRKFGCGIRCTTRFGDYDLQCLCGKAWHTECFEKYSKKDVKSFLEPSSDCVITICLSCKRKAF